MAGFTVDERDLHPSLFLFQRTAVTLAASRAALFEDTGLKSWQMLEWMRPVAGSIPAGNLLLKAAGQAHQFVRATRRQRWGPSCTTPLSGRGRGQAPAR